MPDKGQRSRDGKTRDIYWECQDCGEQYWKSKSACLECGSEVAMHKSDAQKETLTGFFRRLSLLQFLALLLGFAALFLISFFAYIYMHMGGF